MMLQDAPALLPLRVRSWWSGVFWNEHAQLVSVRHRPLLMQWKGEVFWGANYGSCEECDVVVYRAKTHPSSKCLSLHFVNGIAHFSTRLRNNVTDLLASLPDRTGKGREGGRGSLYVGANKADLQASDWG